MTDIVTATSTEVQNNFGRYLTFVIQGQEIIITKNGKRVARVIPEGRAVTYLTDSLTGILKGNYNIEDEKDKVLRAKYEAVD